MRSGKIVYGLDSLLSAKRIKLLAVSDTASENLRSEMLRLAEKRNCSLVKAPSLETSIGHNVKAFGFTDANMAKAALDYVLQNSPQYELEYKSRR